MGPGQNFLTWVGSDQFFVVRIGLVIFKFGFGFGKFPLKLSNFQCFPSDKKKSQRFMSKSIRVRLLFLWVKSMLGLGWVRSGPISTINIWFKKFLWQLLIKFVQPKDAGIYECQVSTEPVSAYHIFLQVKGEMDS